MALVIYSLCALTSAICTYLLAVAYLRSRFRLLLWSAVCFAGLTLNNLSSGSTSSFSPRAILRISTALLAMIILHYGFLIWDTE